MTTYYHAVRFGAQEAQQAQQVCRQVQAYFVGLHLATNIPIYMLSSQKNHTVVVIGIPPSDVVLYDALERLMGDETLALPATLVEQLAIHFHTGKGALGDWQPIATQAVLSVGP